jgi:hypothetical protein
MIDYRVDDYTAHFLEPLPDDLSRETLLRALAEVGPMYEVNLPPVLERLTGRRYRVSTDPRRWRIEADRRITEETFTIEPA